MMSLSTERSRKRARGQRSVRFADKSCEITYALHTTTEHDPEISALDTMKVDGPPADALALLELMIEMFKTRNVTPERALEIVRNVALKRNAESEVQKIRTTVNQRIRLLLSLYEAHGNACILRSKTKITPHTFRFLCVLRDATGECGI